MSKLRMPATNAPVTKEEVAYELLCLVSGGKPESLDKQDVLPTFAKCMMAVSEPEKYLAGIEEDYNINS